LKQRLRRLQVAFVIAFAMFLICSFLVYNYGIDSIIAIQNRFGWGVESTYLFGFAPLVPALIIGILIRRIRCEECGGRLIRTFGSIFPRKCGSCGVSIK
jgi:hypothetical protein